MAKAEFSVIYPLQQKGRVDARNVITPVVADATRAGKKVCGKKECPIKVGTDVSLNGNSVTLRASCDKGESRCTSAVYTAFGALSRNPKVSGLLPK